MLKVALINNMNNNFFALARYLRDKGIDAHVYQVDSMDNHFLPLCDTHAVDDYQQYVHAVSSISFRDFYKLPVSFNHQSRLNALKRELSNFDIVIACGGLAILEWAGIAVDIFIPHGGDLYQSPFMFDYCIKKHFPYSVLMRHYIKYQRRAIAKSRAIISYASIDRHMHDALIKLNEKWLDWPIPMVYPLPDVHTGTWDYLDKNDFVLFSHARQGWKTALDYKGNDRAIRGFAQFIQTQTVFNFPILVMFEYGPDVAASKELIRDLGIQEYVRWMPTMERKYIYEGLKRASLVFDYFHDEVVSFGGVTFEAFCCFKPVIGNKNLKNTATVSDIPLVQAYTAEDVYHVLLDHSRQPQKYVEQGIKSREWFDQHVGTYLVDKYLMLIEYLSENKSMTLRDHRFNHPQLKSFIGPDHIQ